MQDGRGARHNQRVEHEQDGSGREGHVPMSTAARAVESDKDGTLASRNPLAEPRGIIRGKRPGRGRQPRRSSVMMVES